MIRNVLLVMAAVGSLSLAGCDIYFGEERQRDCQPWGCDDGDLAEPGEACSSNWDCAAGCYCNQTGVDAGDTSRGVCEEAGFCAADADCASGFECQNDRASCVPVDAGSRCRSDAECAAGSYCELAWGEAPGQGICVESLPCVANDAECGEGWQCDVDRGTCAPQSCQADADCAESCACDTTQGRCSETGFCASNAECADGMLCDLNRGTCSWAPPGSCVGLLDDPSLPAPACGEGTRAGIEDGKYTGFCVPEATCDYLCENAADEASCDIARGCAVSWTGINCSSPDGSSCSDPNTDNCKCERYVFAGCSFPPQG